MQLTPGTTLGPYEILAPLGAGGMGEVYRARDARLGRDVAVKVLSRHLAGDAEALARFEHEARAVAAISHPNILAIHDVALEGGMPYAVMELLDGESLRERLQRGPLGWRDAAALAVAVADGLAAAHAQGIVHRDLKPENVFVLRDGRVKILDFGLARHVVLPGDDAGVTVAFGGPEGQLLGTIGYMSPEQARGGPIGVTSDLFSLGCLLYELVAGRRPFEYPTPAETISAILYEPPQPLTGSGAAVPDDLARVILHCLEKVPADRYQTARDVAVALQGVLNDSSTRTPPRGGRVVRAPARALAVLPFVNDGGDEEIDYLCDGLTDILVNTLAALPRTRVVPRTVVARYKGRAVEPPRIAAELNASTLVTGRVATRGTQVSVQAELIDAPSNAQIWGQRFVRPATDLFALQDALAAEIAEAVATRLGGRRKTSRRPAAAHTPAPDAYEHYLRGKHAFQQWGARAFARAIEHFEQAILADPDYAPVWAGLANALGASAYFGYTDPALALPRGRAAAERALALDPNDAEAHAALGVTLLFRDWDIARAGAALERAIALNPRLASSYVYYSLFLSATGRHDEAVTTARKGESLDPVTPLPVIAVAWALHMAGRFDEALAQVHRVLDLDPSSVTAHAMLAGDAEARRDLPKAIDRLETLLRLMQEPVDLAQALRTALASGGPPAYWQAKLELVARGVGLFGPPDIVAAAIYTAMGAADTALDRLEAACDARLSGVILMGADPCFHALRGHPRFEALLARVGLPASRAVAAPV